ncbi:hypothetical protein SAMN05892883_0088 [Jatrophihabitans sp. GAS493]|nr:hypothetical protein SAMN05892883_0088 [Jatrophihabitans sp. GAS493]
MVDVTLDEGPLDPFLGDPADPAALLADQEPVEPLSESEHADVLADLYELTEFRTALAPRGVRGICVECSDCGEQHYFSWDLMAANLRSLLGEGRTQVHEPAFEPKPECYVSWDYARGYTDAVQAAAHRR